MDRRQRKTRDAIFRAFTGLLSQKEFHRITVGEIIERADIGRATFYAHFETKDDLLNDLCEELFCHIVDTEQSTEPQHHHIFEGYCSESAFLHLFEHLQNNDHNLVSLLSSYNNELFMRYFKNHLEQMVSQHRSLFVSRKSDTVPDDFWIHHITSTLSDTILWWIHNGMKEPPKIITDYFFSVL